MKQKLIKTFCFEGVKPLDECAEEIESLTGQRFIAHNQKGEVLNGFLNGYIGKIDDKEYTIVDVFVYESNGSVLDEDKKVKYKLQKADISKVEKVTFVNHQENAKIKLLKKLGKYDE